MARPGPPTAKVSDVISSFSPTRRFTPPSPQTSITSLDFDDTGELALVSRTDETLQIYNVKHGVHAKELKSQKYGADLARFAHHAQSVIYASTKTPNGVGADDHAIRYLSTHDNTYIRYFKGHTSPVTSLALNPGSDEIMSCGADATVRLWDLRSPHPQGELHLAGALLAAYDPTAYVMAVACGPAQSILLYDARNYDKAPFATFDLRDAERVFAAPSSGGPGDDWARVEFSNDGNKLLLATAGSGHYVLDAFDGRLVAFLSRPNGPTGRLAPGRGVASSQKAGSVGGQGDACFSPDGRYVVGGSGDASLYVWDLEGKEAGEPTADRALRPVCDLSSQAGQKGVGTASVVGYNPRHNLLVTADRAVVFWLPDVD